MKLIIQIPCYNEAETLRVALDHLPRHIDGVDEIEILIINDGSNDRTVEVAREWGELGEQMRKSSDRDFAEEIATAESARIRSLGDTPDEFFEAAAKSGSVILDQDVLPDGRRELLPLLLEQAVSTTEHRFGYIHGLTP